MIRCLHCSHEYSYRAFREALRFIRLRRIGCEAFEVRACLCGLRVAAPWRPERVS